MCGDLRRRKSDPGVKSSAAFVAEIGGRRVLRSVSAAEWVGGGGGGDRLILRGRGEGWRVLLGICCRGLELCCPVAPKAGLKIKRARRGTRGCRLLIGRVLAVAVPRLAGLQACRRPSLRGSAAGTTRTLTAGTQQARLSKYLHARAYSSTVT